MTDANNTSVASSATNNVGGGRAAFLVASPSKELFAIVAGPHIRIVQEGNVCGSVSCTAAVIAVAFSETDSSLAAVCDDKSLHVWNGPEWTVAHEPWSLPKRPTAVSFAAGGQSVIVADKIGEIREFTVPGEAGQLLLGHLSLVTALVQGPVSDVVISADRDDKVRVSSYPDSYNIVSYCLGHTDFVTGVEVLNEEYLLSGGGDGTLRLWRYRSGEQVAAVVVADGADAPDVAINFPGEDDDDSGTVTSLAWHAGSGLVAVVESAEATVQIFSLSGGGLAAGAGDGGSGDAPSLSLVRSLELGGAGEGAGGSVPARSVAFDASGALWILCGSGGSEAGGSATTAADGGEAVVDTGLVCCFVQSVPGATGPAAAASLSLSTGGDSEPAAAAALNGDTELVDAAAELEGKSSLVAPIGQLRKRKLADDQSSEWAPRVKRTRRDDPKNLPKKAGDKEAAATAASEGTSA